MHHDTRVIFSYTRLFKTLVASVDIVISLIVVNTTLILLEILPEFIVIKEPGGLALS